MNDETRVPEVFPVLSRGRHRNPRKGACFMELASYLAGERWSDRPACTHPLLAGLARHVNDYSSDAARPKLAPLAPAVVGLTSDDPRVDARIALHAAISALPVVAAERQGVMAVSILAAERVLAELEGRPRGSLEDRTRQAFAQAPHAAQWAYRFVRGIRRSPRAFRRYAAPSIVHSAVEGIARACVPDADERLYTLLVGAIDECEAIIRGETRAAADRAPAYVGPPEERPHRHSPRGVTLGVW